MFSDEISKCSEYYVDFLNWTLYEFTVGNWVIKIDIKN